MKRTQEAARKVSTMTTLPEELLKMSEDVQFDLNAQEKRQWRQLLERHKDAFQFDGQPLGRAQLIQHEIPRVLRYVSPREGWLKRRRGKTD